MDGLGPILVTAVGTLLALAIVGVLCLGFWLEIGGAGEEGSGGCGCGIMLLGVGMAVVVVYFAWRFLTTGAMGLPF
jgi:hypothetical protein